MKKQPDALKDLVKEYGKHHFVLIWIDFLSSVQQLIMFHTTNRSRHAMFARNKVTRITCR